MADNFIDGGEPIFSPIIRCHLQVSFAGVNFTPKTVLLLLIVAGIGVVFKHVASPVVGSIVVFTGSDVENDPTLSATNGQIPPPRTECSWNCTWFPGAGKLWSADADEGVTSADSIHRPAPQPLVSILLEITTKTQMTHFTYVGLPSRNDIHTLRSEKMRKL